MSNLQMYTEAVKVIKEAILRSQYRAAASVNKEQLSLYYGIGCYVSKNSREGFWGKGAIETISQQLQKELPGLRGFSVANIKFMRQFYETWCDDLKSLTVVSGIGEDKSLTAVSEIDIQLLIPSESIEKENFELTSFLALGFTHHMIIVRKTASLTERLFYIRQSVINKWSKEVLSARIEDDLFHHQGEIAHNFIQTIPDVRQSLKAIGMFKDEYLLDFINVEELAERDKEDIDERVVEQEIIHNIKKFILTFGRDFAFVGNQYKLEVFGIEHFPDLIFFNRELNALVVIELKKGAFKSTYLGQLCTYLRLMDDQMRKPHENPSIGLVLCKSADKKYVEYVIQDYDKPLGVATYKTSDNMPEKLKRALPDIEELKKLL
ncbi:MULTISPECIES: YhcG family protein [unclassified Butyricimonas]|uniref:PDDEXK nuclease domain-containing protein n=1 Tax=unclassified Butyricimonas TaxID=2637652 RepID=UPI000C07EDD5|nr:MULTISPECIES: PDDEXK nuclease domain-containing protein [unclassified Butyricimonas]